MASIADSVLEECRGIEPKVLTLRTQLVKKGRSRELLADGDHMTCRIHCYAPGVGEHGLHAHLDEDHIFVVLQGEAQFNGINGPLPRLKKNQALALPKGCFYEFGNPTDGPLVMIRFGAGAEKVLSGRRITPDGRDIPGRGANAEMANPVFIDNAFFE